MSEIRISGNLFASKDEYTKGGYSYVVVSPSTNTGWGIPTRDLTPDDLRAMADHFESNLREIEND